MYRNLVFYLHAYNIILPQIMLNMYAYNIKSAIIKYLPSYCKNIVNIICKTYFILVPAATQQIHCTVHIGTNNDLL